MPAAFVVGGQSSGVGKTSITLGLLRALANRGLGVAPFKAGPDYLDPQLHTLAAGRPSRNLDSWLLSKEGVSQSFRRGLKGAEVAVIEGVMGLYDGRGSGPEGSTAQLATHLGIPVVLIVSGERMSRSLGALVKGYDTFDPELSIAGVIINGASSAHHAGLLTQAVRQSSDLPVFGCLERTPDLSLPARHLGLLGPEDPAGNAEERIAAWAAKVEDEVDLPDLLKATEAVLPTPLAGPLLPEKGPSIAVARDEAFSFYYEENLERLQEAGARLGFFSPLRDEALPQGTQGLYLGGGYPELHAETLSGNTALRSEIAHAVAQGLPTYAECGGLMYLSRHLHTPQGRFPMVGAVPATAVMRSRRAALGYVTACCATPTLLCPEGTSLRGHAFHYSDITYSAERYAYRCTTTRNPQGFSEGYAAGALLASYVHLHFAGHPSLARNFIARCS